MRWLADRDRALNHEGHETYKSFVIFASFVVQILDHVMRAGRFAGPYGRIVTFLIVNGVTGWLISPPAPIAVGVLARVSTVSIPPVTLPKIT